MSIFYTLSDMAYHYSLWAQFHCRKIESRFCRMIEAVGKLDLMDAKKQANKKQCKWWLSQINQEYIATNDILSLQVLKARFLSY